MTSASSVSCCGIVSFVFVVTLRTEFEFFFRSPYSDMALLPILAFFFCSAGPFLFFLFAVKQLIGKVKGKLSKVEEVEEKVNSFISSPHVTKSHRVSMSGQTLEKETERLKSFSTESNSTL